MKLSFFPGKLYLSQEESAFVVTVNSTEILRTRSQSRAVAKFNELRREMEERFPRRELTPDEMQDLLQRAIGDALVGPNSIRKKKRSTARGTRTFGG